MSKRVTHSLDLFETSTFSTFDPTPFTPSPPWSSRGGTPRRQAPAPLRPSHTAPRGRFHLRDVCAEGLDLRTPLADPAEYLRPRPELVETRRARAAWCVAGWGEWHRIGSCWRIISDPSHWEHLQDGNSTGVRLLFGLSWWRGASHPRPGPGRMFVLRLQDTFQGPPSSWF